MFLNGMCVRGVKVREGVPSVVVILATKIKPKEIKFDKRQLLIIKAAHGYNYNTQRQDEEESSSLPLLPLSVSLQLLRLLLPGLLPHRDAGLRTENRALREPSVRGGTLVVAA